jgi:hypothetical protein
MPAIWVKDPTKVLKIVMRNPITGGSFWWLNFLGFLITLLYICTDVQDNKY